MANHAAPRNSRLGRTVIGGLLAAGALTMGVSGVASAAPVKDCGTTTTAVNGGLDAVTTETQTSACNSASDQGEVKETRVVNGGGNLPTGQQP